MNLAPTSSLSRERTAVKAPASTVVSVSSSRLSTFVCAALCFTVVNWAFAATANALRLDRFQMLPHGWSWWAAKCLSEEKTPADVLLMGSSLVQRLLNEGEATYLNHSVGALTHRRSLQLESLLGKGLHRPVSTSSYAVGGLHASDASVVTSVLLKGKHKPGAIVYGIAPRDLMNSFLASPAATDTFKLLNKIHEERDISFIARTSTAEKFNYLVATALSRGFPLFDYKSELAESARRLTKQQVGGIADRWVPEPHNPFSVSQQIEVGLLNELYERDIPIYPFDVSHPGNEDNRLLYLSAYKPFRVKFYALQKHFLERLMLTCKRNHIQLILVNMPLRKDNFEAMDDGFYDRFKNDLRVLAAHNSVSLIDMQAASPVTYDDFSDQVHMNGRGSVKFVNALAPRLIPLLTDEPAARQP